MSERTQRARDEWMELHVVDDQLGIQSESGDLHLLSTNGTTAEGCTCPDHQHRGVRCKHMIAYEDWEIDAVVYDGEEKNMLADPEREHEKKQELGETFDESRAAAL